MHTTRRTRARATPEWPPACSFGRPSADTSSRFCRQPRRPRFPPPANTSPPRPGSLVMPRAAVHAAASPGPEYPPLPSRPGAFPEGFWADAQQAVNKSQSQTSMRAGIYVLVATDGIYCRRGANGCLGDRGKLAKLLGCPVLCVSSSGAER